MSEIPDIEHIKSACIVIGYRKKGTPYPTEIMGTGFAIDPEGFIVTATHVVDGIKKTIEKLVKKELEENGLVKEDLIGKELEIYNEKFKQLKEQYEFTATFTEVGEETVSIKTTPMLERRGIYLEIEGLEDYLPKDHDVTVCRMFGKWGNFPYLKLKKPSKLDVLSGIFMCGFPRGSGTFNPFDLKSGKRVSPIIQTGKISSLMPVDRTKRPVGMFTDIIGVGGSSGSPLIDEKTGEVIGIAQSVVGASVFDKLGNLSGSAAIGIVWGVTFFFLYGPVLKMVEAMKTVTTENGESTLEEGDVIHLGMTVGESMTPSDIKFEIIKKENLPPQVKESFKID